MNTDELMQDERVKNTIIELSLYMATEMTKEATRLMVSSSRSAESIMVLAAEVSNDMVLQVRHNVANSP